MKKLLLSTAAVFALGVAAPAQAEGFLSVGGEWKGYAVYNDFDAAGDDRRKFDFRKETEAHFSGETTLDNGLTVGAHAELNIDRATEGFGGANGADANERLVDESYGYFSGGWGRVNFGEEDGAAYLLQVAAPSADSNVDGLRQYIQTFDLASMGAAAMTDRLDYDQGMTGHTNKLTYLTPSFNGFQAGVSYTPSLGADLDALSPTQSSDDPGDLENGLEIAARYEGEFNGVGVAAGAGYGKASDENGSADRKQYNAGLDLDFAGFGVGVAYLNDDNGIANNGDTSVLVVGADYEMGPYTLGLSYYDREDEAGATNVHTEGADVDTTRWTVGAGYEFGPGMSFRGAVQHVDVETATVADAEEDAMQITLGANVNF